MNNIFTKKNPIKSGNAFTLIELLVVIAIIAILAAILFPVFGRARENARRSACLSNMKQWGLCFMQYAQDYDGRFPLMGYEGNSASDIKPPSYWYNSVYAYNKSKGIQACPSDASTRNGEATLVDSQGNATDANGNAIIGRFSYLINDQFGGADFVGPVIKYNPVNEAQIPAPSEVILMTEGVRGFNWPYFAQNIGCMITGENVAGSGAWFGDPCPDGVVPSADRPQLPRHFSGANFLFADGHAKWRKVGDKDANGKNVSMIQAVMPWAKYGDPTQQYANDLNNSNARKWF